MYWLAPFVKWVKLTLSFVVARLSTVTQHRSVSQVAEKLGLPQITYAEEIIDCSNNQIIVKRRLERGIEVVKGSLPMVITVNGSAANCRPRHAKLTLKYKHAATPTEKQDAGSDYTDLYSSHPYLNINEWESVTLSTTSNG